MSPSPTAKVATPASLIASLIVLIFGKSVSGATAQLVGLILTAITATATAAVHKGTAKKVVKKVVHKVKHGKGPIHRKPKNPFTMYDAITVGNIPRDAKAVAGYVGGIWPTFAELEKLFPYARRLSIAINQSEDAECLDCEPGDATPAEVAAWVERQVKRGVYRPVVYASVSTMPKILRLLAAAHIPRHAVRLWTAHYTGRPHICGPKCGFGLNTTADATQYEDKALGRNLDASLVDGDFFDKLM